MSEYALAQAGDDGALRELTRRHMPMVYALCARFRAPLLREDAFQQGCMGLVKAIRRFDEGRGLAFSTYAVPVILGEIRALLRKNEMRVGWRARGTLSRAYGARDMLRAELGYEPSVRDIALRAKIDAEELMLLMERAGKPLQRVDEGALACLPDYDSMQWLERFLLWDIVERLPFEESRILCLRYRHDKSQSEVARLLGSTQSRVSRREKRACERVRAEWI